MFGGPRSAVEHYLVAVSGSRNSEYLLRWTAAAVRRSGATWTVVHVRSWESEEAPGVLDANLDLARKLGAEVFSIPAEDIAVALVRYARIKKATALVIGKSEEAPSSFRERKSVMERILRDSGDLNVILLRGEAPSLRRRRRFPFFHFTTPLRDFVVVLGIVGVVTLLGFLVHWVVGYQSITVFYLLGIISGALVAGRSAVYFGAALSALCWNFAFVPPRLKFSFHNLEDTLLFASFFVSALVVGFLTTRLKRNEAALSVREERMAMLYGFSRLLSRTRGAEEIASVAAAYLSDYLGAEVSVLLKGRKGGLEIGDGVSGQVDEAIAMACLEENEFVSDGSGRWYFPLTGPERPLGVLCFEGLSDRDPRGEGKELFSTLSGNIALAIERETHRTAVESERLSRTLLNHVSHELRTPLTTIKGSVSALLESSPEAPSGGEEAEFRSELLSQTLVAADKLNDLVENLLAMSRLESGVLSTHPEDTDVTELIGAARESLRDELEGRVVTIDPTCAGVEFFVDPALMVQVFRNVLRNFIAYTPVGSSLRVSASSDDRKCEVRLADDGPGIAPHEFPSIFETFSRGANGARHPGCGLGLSICKGIIEAHGGSIRAEPSDGGGFTVVFCLPARNAV